MDHAARDSPGDPSFVNRKLWFGVAFAARRVDVCETEVVKCMARRRRLSVTVDAGK